MSAPGKLALHRMGFYNDQSGIIRRYKREESVWQPHIEACKRLIIRAVSETEPRHITVTGAGSLLDLPLPDLIRQNRTITLVDIVPPLPAVTEAANLQGVSFLEDDVSGGLVERVYRLTSRTVFRHKVDVPALLDFGSWSPPAGTDMVISLNILTQLTALPVDYLRRKDQDNTRRGKTHQTHCSAEPSRNAPALQLSPHNRFCRDNGRTRIQGTCGTTPRGRPSARGYQ